ncbi:MAG: glycoside hydrolase family 15 protein, partial [Hymenobacter sp.]
MPRQPHIQDLGVVSDRRTCALLDQQGTLCWYCPGRFDSAAVLSLLLDAEQGGYWAVEALDKQFVRRAYLGRSSVLVSEYTVAGQPFTLTDWLPLQDEFTGLCRSFSAAGAALTHTLRLRPDYGLQATLGEVSAEGTTVHFPDLGLWLRTAHPVRLVADTWQVTVPAGEASWAVLTGTEAAVPGLSAERLSQALARTLAAWREVADLLHYDGPYERQVQDSIRAIQQLTYEATGGIVAAATT